MGQEIYYCAGCQEQIRSSDLDSGRAFRLDNRHFCLKCGPEALRSLPNARAKEIFKTISTPAKAFPIVPETPSPRPSSPRLARAERRSSPWIVPGAIAAAIAGVTGIAYLLMSPSEPAPAPLPAPVSRPVAAPTPRPVPPPDPKPAAAPTPVPAPTPVAPVPDKERIAREALQKAREWAATNPSDFDGAVRRYQDACFLATGTASLAEATKDLELFRKKQREFFRTELSSLEPEVKAACAEERFMKALDILRLAKDRHGSAEWQLMVGKRSREINDDAFRLLDRIKEEALEAQRRGDEEKLKALRARVASWGVGQFIKDFRDAVDK